MIYRFQEPHPTGGTCTITITDKKILEYMIKRAHLDERLQVLSDKELIDEFVTVHWCFEEK